MDVVKMKWKKKNLIVKAWERCCSVGTAGTKKSSSSSGDNHDALKKSKSWHCSSNTLQQLEEEGDGDHKGKNSKNSSRAAPEGCFSVYVGPQRQRFVIKTEFANHPLFKMLLEDAELEYGFNSEGPLLLPCDVDLFYKVLAEMDESCDSGNNTPVCTPLILCSPSRGSTFNKGYGSYKLLTPSPMLKLNGH